jgi:hypothetical protein
LPYHVFIDEPNRTIAIKGTGSGTTADTLALIASQQQTFRDHAGFNLLYDTTEMEIASSPADMMTVAQALFETNETAFGRIAVVVPASREELARIFSALAHPHGFNTNVFTQLSDARRWLGIDR